MKQAPISKKEIFKFFKIYEESKYTLLSLNHLAKVHEIPIDRLLRLAKEYIKIDNKLDVIKNTKNK